MWSKWRQFPDDTLACGPRDDTLACGPRDDTLACGPRDDTLNYNVSKMNFQAQPKGSFEFRASVSTELQFVFIQFS